jgi:phenylacetic acid degradation operon negative regulatory protein
VGTLCQYLTPDTFTDAHVIRIDVPTSYFIYSSLAFFGSRRGYEIPGTWFVRALEPFGRSPEVVRTELHRMVRDGELTRRKDGRRNFYRPTAVAHAELDAGTKRIFAPTKDRWDGRWTIVIAHFTTVQRAQRDRLHSLLQVEGFAPLGHGVAIHPRPPSEGLERAIADMKLHRAVTVLSGARGDSNATDRVARLWDLSDMERGYERFLARYGRVRLGVSNRDAFALRFAVVFDFLKVAWRDPDLPRSLLPRRWSGHRAKRMAADLYRRLLPGAIAHAEALLSADER